MNKYFRAVSANMIFFIINTVFFLAITPIAIKVMGNEFYGLWSILIALMLLTNVGALGINSIVMKFSSEAIEEGNTKVQWDRVMTGGYLIVGIMAILITASLIVFKSLIVNNIHTTLLLKEQLNKALLWIAVGILPQFLSLVPQGFLIGQLQNHIARSITLFSSISLWGGAVAITLYERNLAFISFWCFFSNTIAFSLYVWCINKYIWQFHWHYHLPTFKRMLNFSKWMFLQSLAIALFSQFDRVIVGFTLGPVLAGVYSVATSVALRLSLVVGQVTEIMLPYASLKDSMGHQQPLYKIFRQLSYYTSLFIALASSLLIIWMQEILTLWISPDYAAQYTNSFRILIIAYSFLSLSRPAHQTLTGIGKIKFSALVYFLSTISMLLGILFLSQRYGLMGAAAADVMMIVLLIYNLYIYHYYGKSNRWQDSFTDLRWGVVLPVIVFALSLFLSQINLIYKSMATMILLSCFAFVMGKDQVLKRKISQTIISTTKNRS